MKVDLEKVNWDSFYPPQSIIDASQVEQVPLDVRQLDIPF